jgi:hypothetical protein
MEVDTEKRGWTHIPFICLLLVLAIYLGIKTFHDAGWSGWKMGSAQTLLTVDYWDRDGIIDHKILFIPMGYSRAATYLDEPSLRHHARGIVTGSFIGRRLYYTHYPPGYLIPSYLLKKIGADSRSSFRLLGLGISLGALILMYASFNIIARPFIAFIGALYYGISTTFLNYADSLANQPIDDLLRFLIVFLSLRSFSRKDGGWKGFGLIWALYFVLTITSYDSVFFIFIWLLGLDIIRWLSRDDRTVGNLPLKRWALLAIAPVSAFGLQQLQNLWYLGWHDLLLDLKGSFLARAGHGEGNIRLVRVGKYLKLLTGMSEGLAVAILAILTYAFVYLKKKSEYKWPDLRLLVLFFIAGAAYPLVFTKTSELIYQGRQFVPVVSLLVGISVFMLFKGPSVIKALAVRKRAAVINLTLLGFALLVLFGAQVKGSFAYLVEWPNNSTDKDIIENSRDVGRMSQKDAIIFHVNRDFKKENPQPSLDLEYYSGRLVLNFRNPAQFKIDYERIKELASEPFDAILITPHADVINEYLPLSKNREIRKIGDIYALLIEW